MTLRSQKLAHAEQNSYVCVAKVKSGKGVTLIRETGMLAHFMKPEDVSELYFIGNRRGNRIHHGPNWNKAELSGILIGRSSMTQNNT